MLRRCLHYQLNRLLMRGASAWHLIRRALLQLLSGPNSCWGILDSGRITRLDKEKPCNMSCRVSCPARCNCIHISMRKVPLHIEGERWARPFEHNARRCTPAADVYSCLQRSCHSCLSRGPNSCLYSESGTSGNV